MDDRILTANIAATAATQAPVADRVRRADGAGPMEIHAARSGDPTAHTTALRPDAPPRTVRLHSRYDPRTEARRTVDALPPAATLVCLGFGLGWTVTEYLEKYRHASALVIEPSSAALRQAFGVRDFSPWLHSGRLRFAQNEEEVGETLSALHLPMLHDGVATYTTPGATPADTAASMTTHYTDILRTTLDGIAGELVAMRRFGRSWLAHTVVNSLAVDWDRQRTDVAELPTRLADNVVVAAAGPSLDRWLDDVCAPPEGSVVAVDTALPGFLARDIAPTVVVTLDPQGWSALHARTPPPPGTTVVADVGSSSALYRRATSRVMAGSHHPLHRLMIHRGFPLPILFGGADNVTTAAVRLAKAYGKRVDVVGADGCFPRGATYARGTYHHLYAGGRQTLLSPVETFFADQVYRAGTRAEPDEYGRPVFHRDAMDRRRRELERSIIEETPPVDTQTLEGSGFSPASVRTFWRRHGEDLKRIVSDLAEQRPSSTPEILRTLGADGAAHLPLAASLHRSQTRDAQPRDAQPRDSRTEDCKRGGYHAVEDALRAAGAFIARCLDP